MTSPKRIVILGSTGSIGTQTLDVIEHLNAQKGPHTFEVVGLAAGRASAELAKQIERFNPRFVSTCSEECLDSKAEQIAGEDAAEELVRRAHEVVGVDLVVGAIVGSAGLGATLAAVELGIDVALANKETLVAAGELVVAACSRIGSSVQAPRCCSSRADQTSERRLPGCSRAPCRLPAPPRTRPAWRPCSKVRKEATASRSPSGRALSRIPSSRHSIIVAA